MRFHFWFNLCEHIENVFFTIGNWKRYEFSNKIFNIYECLHLYNTTCLGCTFASRKWWWIELGLLNATKEHDFFLNKLALFAGYNLILDYLSHKSYSKYVFVSVSCKLFYKSVVLLFWYRFAFKLFDFLFWLWSNLSIGIDLLSIVNLLLIYFHHVENYFYEKDKKQGETRNKLFSLCFEQMLPSIIEFWLLEATKEASFSPFLLQ